MTEKRWYRYFIIVLFFSLLGCGEFEKPKAGETQRGGFIFNVGKDDVDSGIKSLEDNGWWLEVKEGEHHPEPLASGFVYNGGEMVGLYGRLTESGKSGRKAFEDELARLKSKHEKLIAAGLSHNEAMEILEKEE